MGTLRRLGALLALSAVVLGAPPARATPSFEGKTIRLIVGYDAVGGYAVYARLLAPYLARALPGKPSIVVQYMPSGGGVTLANYLANVAAPDGLTIGMLPRSVPFQPLMGNTLAQFRPEQFTWLGTSSSYQNDAYCMIVRTDSGVRTLADLQRAGRPFPFGSEAAGGTNTDLLLIAKDVFSLNIQVVRGYRGPGEIGMAMERNEVIGRSIGMSSLQLFAADWIKEGRLRCLVQFNRKRWVNLPDAPTARELTQTAEQLKLIELAETPLLLARPYAAPPRLPSDIAATLKAAFMAAHRDAEFLAINEKAKSDISPLDGDEVQGIVRQITQTPPELIARYKAALEAK